MIPANLRRAGFVLEAAELPGIGRVWEVWERLDLGMVTHLRYVGILPPAEDESAEGLMERAADKVGLKET